MEPFFPADGNEIGPGVFRLTSNPLRRCRLSILNPIGTTLASSRQTLWTIAGD
ncbi:MAG: hypothetical protein ACXWG7_01315 [Chthoniobacterales bacterium]